MSTAQDSPTAPAPPPPGRVEINNALRRSIYGFVFARVKNAAQADDITQEVLIRIHRRIHTLKHAERLNAWIFQIARNAISDFHRASGTGTPLAPDVLDDMAAGQPDLSSDDENLDAEVTRYIRSVVEELPEKYREALLLTEFGGLGQGELARQLDISVSAAKSRVQRARSEVKEIIERCCRWETDRYGAVVNVERKSPDACSCSED